MTQWLTMKEVADKSREQKTIACCWQCKHMF